LLACNPFGATEAIMHVHGFTRPMLATLVRAGLTTAQSETGKAIAVGRIRITDAGRRWLEDAAKSELRGPKPVQGLLAGVNRMGESSKCSYMDSDRKGKCLCSCSTFKARLAVRSLRRSL